MAVGLMLIVLRIITSGFALELTLKLFWTWEMIPLILKPTSHMDHGEKATAVSGKELFATITMEFCL